MNRDGRGSTVGVAELLVGAALADFDEAQTREKRYDLTRLEDRDSGHLDDYGVGPDELGLQLGFAVLEQHGDDFAKIRMQLVERCALAMRAGEAGDVADV